MLKPEAKLSPSTVVLREQLTQAVAEAELPKSFRLTDGESKQLATFMHAWTSASPTEREPLLNKKLRRTAGKSSPEKPRDPIDLAGKSYTLPFSLFINQQGECFLLTKEHLGSGSFCRTKLMFLLNMKENTLLLSQPKALLRYSKDHAKEYGESDSEMSIDPQRTEIIAIASHRIYGSQESRWFTGSKSYVTMPFIPGRTFSEYTLGRGDNATLREYQLAIAYIRAVASIHENGIIHGDIGFHNFLVVNEDSQPDAFPVDFDFSDDALAPEKMAIARGTPTYAAPEVRRGEISVTQASDMWSLGVMLVLLLATHDKNYQEFLQEIKKESPTEAAKLVNSMSFKEMDVFDEIDLSASLSRMFEIDTNKRLPYRELSSVLNPLSTAVKKDEAKPALPAPEEKRSSFAPIGQAAKTSGSLGLFGEKITAAAPAPEEAVMAKTLRPFDDLFD